MVEHRASDTEIVLKALPKPYVSIRDFYREFHYSLHLSAHRNVVTTFDVAFETAGFYVFCQEYAPLGTYFHFFILIIKLTFFKPALLHCINAFQLILKLSANVCEMLSKLEQIFSNHIRFILDSCQYYVLNEYNI